MDIISRLLQSRKFVSKLAAQIVMVLAYLNYDVDEEVVIAVIGLIEMTWVAAQGLADQGKEAAVQQREVAELEIAAALETTKPDSPAATTPATASNTASERLAAARNRLRGTNA